MGKRRWGGGGGGKEGEGGEGREFKGRGGEGRGVLYRGAAILVVPLTDYVKHSPIASPCSKSRMYKVPT